MGRASADAGQQEVVRKQSYYHCRKEFDLKTRSNSGCDCYFTVESKLSSVCPWCGQPLAHIALADPPPVVHHIPQPSCAGCRNSCVCPLCFGDDARRKPDNCRDCVCAECCGHAISLSRELADAVKGIPGDRLFEYIFRQRKLAEVS